MDKYVFLSAFLKSFCDSYVDHDWQRNKTVNMLRSLKDGMDLLSIFSSHTGKVESCIQTTTKPYHESISTDGTTREVDHDWHEKVNSYAKDVIDAETKRLKPKSWKDRQSLHEAVANGIVQRFNGPRNTKKYRYEALVYLPYRGGERHAFIKLPNNVDVGRSDYASVNYVVTRRLRLNPSTNLTARMKEVEKRFGPLVKQDGFRALAALRCGYEFAWYQLGYRYFPAGYATGSYTLFTESENKYNDKCGQIVFFP